jgi:exodeoxyribonuclease VII small subunit
MSGATEDLSFEQALEALEDRVRRIESGELSLDEALAVYEEGVALSRQCGEQLDVAETRVSALVRGARGIQEQAIEDGQD